MTARTADTLRALCLDLSKRRDVLLALAGEAARFGNVREVRRLRAKAEGLDLARLVVAELLDERGGEE